MRQPFALILIPFLVLPPCFAQSAPILVGQGATTSSISSEFLAAFQRDDFPFTVALPPLGEVGVYGTGGFRQEFQDPARSGIRSALIRPANPDLSLGVNSAVRQVRAPIYGIYTQSSLGPSIAGFPSIDTTRFSLPSANSSNTPRTGVYQTFDRGFGIFVWDQAPADTASDTRFILQGPIFTRWNLIGFDQVGAPITSQVSTTSTFSTRADFQVFSNGGIYAITSGSLTGRIFYLRPAVQALYQQNQGPSGFLGLPINDETLLADGRRRQSFEGGTMEYALNGTPILKNAVSSVSVAAEDPILLTVGESRPLTAILRTNAGESVTDRDVFWTTSNGRAVTITGTGTRVTIRGVSGGSAILTATSEGKVSNRITVFVAAQCCAIGEGAPTQAISQTFQDALLRNRLTVRLPVSSPVRRNGPGFTQEATALPSGTRILLAKADSSPVAYVISGSTLTAFEAQGAFNGTLGFPLSDASAGGTQRFENGALAGSPVRTVSSAILTRWLALSAEAGLLGPPLAERTTSITFTGSAVSSQLFRSGALFQFVSGPLAGRALLTSGPIAAKHAELGFASGSIGAPLTDEFLSSGAFRQEFEGAFLEYSPGSPVRVIDKERRTSLTVTPSSLLPGARYRVAIGGFPANSRLRITQGAANTSDAFDLVSANGSFVWESVVPSNARPGVVLLRATLSTATQTFAEGSYTVRSLTELRPVITKLSGDTQSSAPATFLAAPLRVVVRDSAGNPLSGVPLRFEASPGASVADATPVTNAEGLGQARLRLPSQSGVALLSVEAAGQLVTFTARATEQIPSDFPRITQAVEGNLGSSNLPLAQKGSLVASLAGLLRFYQQRGITPPDNGLADTLSLNAYLRSFCVLDAEARSICDGFLDAGPGTDPQPNPFRALDFSSGTLSLSFPDPNLGTLRDAIANSGPVILALQLSRNGQPSGTHFVTAFGITSDADLVISDPNPQFAQTRLSQYTSGFTSSGATWRATLAAAIQLAPRTSSANAFYLFSSSSFDLASPALPCSVPAAWSATFADPNSTAAPQTVRYQTCDGTAPSYRAALPQGPFVLSLVSLSNPPALSTVSGVDPATYRLSRSNSDSWSLAPEQLSFTSAAILNAASFSPRLSPGTIISIFGNGLPLTSSNSSLQVEGQTLPIFFSNGFQLNTALPPNLPPGQATLLIRSPFGEATANLEISDLAPAIFTIDARSSGAILNQDSSLSTTSNPAIRGQAVVLFATGLGPVTPQSNGLSTTNAPLTVVINGRELTPFFAGLAPGFIGLYQVNVLLPLNLPPGIEQTVLLRSRGIDSNSSLISIR
jgi:uncharacterized protein (TIGR03437 family)